MVFKTLVETTIIGGVFRLSFSFIDDDKSEFVVMASYHGNKTKAVAAEGCVYGGAVYVGFLWD